MEKLKILITSSSRIEVLAKSLREQLVKFVHAKLLKEEIEGGHISTIKLLEEVSHKYDFAVIILDAIDINNNMKVDSLKEREDRFFEAGLFIAALGQERCFFVSSVKYPQLPSDLEGIKLLHFTEPDSDKLNDYEDCSKAIRIVGEQILDSLEHIKTPKTCALSKEMLLDREKMRPAGELEEDHIVVTVTQPIQTDYETVFQVRKNMDAGIAYAFCFYGDSKGIQKICLFLQMLLVAPLLDGDKNADFQSRIKKILDRSNQRKILEDLESICTGQHLKIYFLKDPPELQYIIHNANSVTDAILYLKQRDRFIEWERGESAHKFWIEMSKNFGIEKIRKTFGFFTQSSSAMFCGASGFKIKKGNFYINFKTEMKKVFPEIDEKVTKLCCDGL